MKVRAISLWQPWASAMALGVKRIETRGWVSRYTGPLAVHAAQRKSAANRAVFNELMDDAVISEAFLTDDPAADYDALPYGAVLGIVRMVDCVALSRANIGTLSDTERLLGDYRPGRQAWVTNNARPLRSPHAAGGRQGFFWVDVPVKLWPVTAAGSCRMCGCTETTACRDERGQPCSWVAADLCSACEAGE
jgi:hypothetical protein